MGSNLERLLTKNRIVSKSEKKCVNFFVRPSVHEAFGRACREGGYRLSHVMEALMLDFISSRVLAPENLKHLKFIGTAEQYTKSRKEQEERETEREARRAFLSPTSENDATIS